MPDGNDERSMGRLEANVQAIRELLQELRGSMETRLTELSSKLEKHEAEVKHRIEKQEERIDVLEKRQWQALGAGSALTFVFTNWDKIVRFLGGVK